MTFMPLSRRAGGMQAFKLIIPGSLHAAATDPQSHEGYEWLYEWLYVLNGRLRLVLGGSGPRAHPR